MERREFFHASALTAGALAFKHEQQAQEPTLHPALAALKSLRGEQPPAIGDEERAARRAKAQRLMSSAAVDALLVEPGPTMKYFTNIDWGRSERLFALMLPQRGDALFICPAFERALAESKIADKFKVRVWQEDESPYTLISNTLRDWGYATGTLAVDSSARYFVPFALSGMKPSLKIVSVDPITQW